ncbi:MAG: XdhC family protein [Cyanobacteriota bacterium]|nr:XdhC family protein [Cyanobacteriota bacterium]
MDLIDLFHALQSKLLQGSVVLATVVQTQGSVPREVGARMIVAVSSQTFGTIGGGAGEYKVIQIALEMLRNHSKPQWVTVDLTGIPKAGEKEGICGGWMKVWLAIWQGDKAYQLARTIGEDLRQQGWGILTTFFDPRLPCWQSQIQLSNFTLLANSNNHQFPEKFSSKPCHQISDHDMQEVLIAPPTLLIVGAGHIGLALAKVARVAEFRVIIYDDREELAWAESPGEFSTLLGSISEMLPELAGIPNLYVALLTRGYAIDVQVLPILLDYPLSYLGMIGSQRRIQMVYQHLREMGYSETILQKIRAPIGLDIGALTPGEIAISIGAEIIAHRRQHNHSMSGFEVGKMNLKP